MLKSLLVTIHFIGIMFLSIMAPKDVKVSHNAPVFMTVGEEVSVTVTFDKGKIDGFAKFQVNVPPGMVIEPGDISGASYTFKDGEAKFIWMALPDDPEFQIDYTLRVESGTQVGNNDIEQWFSFLEKNERKTVVLPLHVVEIAEEDVSNADVDDALANGIRTITQLNDDHFLVEIELYKDGIKGFAKLQEILPTGMSAEPVKKANGVFTQLDDKVKIVWFSIPEQENLKIVYEVFTTEPVDRELTVRGEFTYLKDNETKTMVIRQGEYNYQESEPIVDNTTVVDSTTTDEDISDNAPGNNTDNEATDQVVDNTDQQTETEVEENSNDMTADTDKEPIEEDTNVADNFSDITNTPSPDTGVAYRVQIAAGHNVVDEIYFKKRHRFNDGFDIENHEGWVKYTTGSHDEYRQARDSRNHINNNYNFDGPFVTAYNRGVRITVQEALMITRQKWYQ